jgi:WD40 repeat protein
LPTGHIVYARDGAILAVPFDLRTRKIAGPTVTMVTDVMTEPGSGAAQFDVAYDAEALLYVPGGPNIERQEFVWFDREGKITPVGAPLQSYFGARLSPDGNRIAATVFGATDTVVVYDIARSSTLRVASEGNSTVISWDDEGRRLLISSDAKGGDTRRLYLTQADGTGAAHPIAAKVVGDFARVLTDTAGRAGVTDGSGRAGVIYADASGLAVADLEGKGEQRITGSGETKPARPAISPDGRWVAYDAGPPGQRDVYVRAFPSGNGMWQVSHGGGYDARWSPRGDELMFQRGTGPTGELDRVMMSARVVATADGFSASPPKEGAKIPAGLQIYSFHPDGRRFLCLRPVPPQFKGDRVVAILNWFDQVRTKAPTK